ncbi:MAG: hypothetical protein HY690_09710 [Chloroflexi bacterium]|nr:hypothetical protein [Chloroflexota bacterium]
MSQARKRIVVVDPVPTTLELISYLLEREGYETFPFARVEDAVDFLESHAVDLVLTETIVPVDRPRPLDGLGPLLGLADRAQIVLCSSHPRASAVADARIREVIPRPFDLNDFLARIARLLAAGASVRK